MEPHVERSIDKVLARVDEIVTAVHTYMIVRVWLQDRRAGMTILASSESCMAFSASLMAFSSGIGVFREVEGQKPADTPLWKCAARMPHLA